MSQRVHLPPDERREQIVRGALQIFAEKGFDAATNKDIARVAGISSTGLIYHYFKDKIDLLRSVVEMQMRSSSRPNPDSLLRMSLEEGLRTVAHQFLTDINRPGVVAFTRVIMGEAMRRPEFAKVLSELMVGHIFATMTAFFRHHQEQGNIRPIDPTLLTLRFAASLTGVLIMREILHISAVRELELEVIENGLVDDFIRGILP